MNELLAVPHPGALAHSSETPRCALPDCHP